MASDDPRSTVLRLRHRIADNLALAVVVCLLLAGAGGFVAADEATKPDTETEQRVVATWTTNSEFTHRATVQQTSRAFDAGTVLHNQSAYLSRISPVLSGAHVYRHDGDAESTTVSTEIHLVKRSVDPTMDGLVEYWRVSEPLAANETTLAAGETARTTFAVNVSQQINETRQIESELGGTPGQVQLFLLATTRVETTVDGQSMNESRDERLTIQPRGSTYAVTANVSGERTREVTERVSVSVESNPLRTIGGSLLALLFLGLGAGLIWADRHGRLGLSSETVAAIRMAAIRDDFDEWISVGSVPAPTDDERVVGVDSLEDLVDVAIDSDRRVIESTHDDRFVVLDDRSRYVYDPTVPSPTPTGDEQTDAESAVAAAAGRDSDSPDSDARGE